MNSSHYDNLAKLAREKAIDYKTTYSSCCGFLFFNQYASNINALLAILEQQSQSNDTKLKKAEVLAEFIQKQIGLTLPNQQQDGKFIPKKTPYQKLLEELSESQDFQIINSERLNKVAQTSPSLYGNNEC